MTVQAVNSKREIILPKNTNEALSMSLLQELVKRGVHEYCICPGKRNHPLFKALMREKGLKKYFWFEERSAAFFALGRSRATGHPLAIITTSGTAVAELLPATMEAHYTAVPLVLITADRPRHYRGTCAPQTAEQVGIFGVYAHYEQDLADDDLCDLTGWSGRGPAHLNVCYEEPLNETFADWPLLDLSGLNEKKREPAPSPIDEQIDPFFAEVEYPLVAVSTLAHEAKEAVLAFLLALNAPVYLEGISGLREDPRLQHLRIKSADHMWQHSEQADYPIDGILRIGGVPTLRLWRDLEDRPYLRVCSISQFPFSGLSGRGVISGPLDLLLSQYKPSRHYETSLSQSWLQQDNIQRAQLLTRFTQEPTSEPSLIHHLSKLIPKGSNIYLGNSLPIREWDLAACDEDRQFKVTASRGVNGIDGQISTFLGLCEPHASNWAILGDLTALYDMAGPWILSQL